MLISRAKRRIFESEVLPYFGKKWQEGIKKREILQKKLLYLVGFSTITEFLEKISPKTCAIFIQGGTGTRWRDSLGNKNNLSLIDNYDIDKKNPRSIVRIANFLPGVPGNRIALGAYNIFSFARTAGQIIIIHAPGQNDSIQKEIIKPLGLENKIIYVVQNIYPGYDKPLGHGDALMQLLNSPRNQKALEVFHDSIYTLTCFAGLPSRRTTVEFTLLAMYVRDLYKTDISWLSPTTVLKTPRYPILIDKTGKVIGLGHEKLLGKNSIKLDFGLSPNNIGIHVFKSADTIKILKSVYRKFSKSISYKAIFPKNKLEEFALDHIMAKLIERNRLFVLNIADSKELANEVKRVEAIPGFIKDIEALFIEDLEPKKMTRSEVITHMNKITKHLTRYPQNLVLLDSDPFTRGAGAGHSRQIYMMELFLRACKVNNLITHISLTNIAGNSILSKIIFSIYKHLQDRPILYDLVFFLLKLLGNQKIIDRELVKNDMSEEVISKLRKAVNFKERRPTIFITTHVVEAMTAVNLIKKKIFKAAVLEYIPDPFPPIHLQMMSSPITCPNHKVAVHDIQTADFLKSIHPAISKNTGIYPLGTLSNYQFLIQKKGN